MRLNLHIRWKIKKYVYRPLTATIMQRKNNLNYPENFGRNLTANCSSSPMEICKRSEMAIFSSFFFCANIKSNTNTSTIDAGVVFKYQSN